MICFNGSRCHHPQCHKKKIRIRTCIQNRIITLIKEVPSRIELLYTVLQTVASPLGHGTIKKEVIPQGVVLPFMAVRTRFELVVGLLLRQFSKLVVSATHPPHRGLFFRIISDWWCKGSMFFAIIQIIDHKFSQKNIFYRKNCLLPMYLRTLCLHNLFNSVTHRTHSINRWQNNLTSPTKSDRAT